MPLDLAIDRASNVIVIDGHAARGRRRWEAVVLAALIEGRHSTPLSAANANLMNALLLPLGQPTTLTRKQWALLWQSLAQMFASASAETTFRSRLHHAPRGATVGPWWWTPQPEDRTQIAGATSATTEIPLPCLAVDGGAGATVSVCRQFLVAQGLMSDGQLRTAAEALQPGPAWANASPEANALRLLRLGEVELLRRRFADARTAAAQALRIAVDQEVVQAYLGGQIALLDHRIAYAEQPVTGAAAIRAALTSRLRRPPCARHLEVDPLARGLALNLAGLCERRWIERHARCLPATALAQHADTALAYWSAALFGFLVSNQHEHVHNMCSNLGYFFQRLTELDVQPQAESALEWYALAQAWHFRFDLPDSTVWEFVFLGDFWLGCQDARALMSGARWRGLWAGLHPGSLDFYAYSVQRAEEIGEPRQKAHTALNLWRFCCEKGMMAPMHQALASLGQTLAEHPDLSAIFKSEGYCLPDSRSLASPALDARGAAPSIKPAGHGHSKQGHS
jgi:hypothetical protein